MDDVPVAVEVEGVGNRHPCVLVEQGALREHLAAEGVHRGNVGIVCQATAGKHLRDLFARDAFSSIVEHAECIGDAQW